LDLFKSIRPHNLIPMMQVGLRNFSLVRYLVGQLAASKTTKFAALKEFYPEGDPKDWYRITAGQRVQVIKKDPEKGGILQFGTEVVAAEDGSIAGLLGASPGASTAVPIMLGLVERCFPDRFEGWKGAIQEMVPSFGEQLGSNLPAAKQAMDRTTKVLEISQ
jgi:malate dehydrogenase (quinone)